MSDHDRILLKENEARFLKLVDAVWDAMEAHDADADEFFLVSLYVMTQMIEDEGDLEEREGMARIVYGVTCDAVGGEVKPERPKMSERRTTPRWR